MAELCSSMPTAGGLYYAAAVLAPEGWGPLASWITGWSNFCGFISGPASVNYALAAMLITCGEIAYPDTYEPKTWHVYLTLLGLLIVQGIITMQSTKFIGWVNKVSPAPSYRHLSLSKTKKDCELTAPQVGTVANVVVIIIFVIWFPVGSINQPKFNKSSEVWTTFTNGTEWPIGWATIMGFLTTIWTMSGYDAPFHLSEECSNANIAGMIIPHVAEVTFPEANITHRSTSYRLNCSIWSNWWMGYHSGHCIHRHKHSCMYSLI